LIGNDIIDFTLFLKETNWKRPNFLNKIYTVKEQEQILNAPDPPVLIAIFWAMKEAAYKAHHRRFNLPRKYNPINYSCTLDTLGTTDTVLGNIEIFDNYYTAKILRHSKFIHCTAKAFDINILQKIYKDNVNLRSELVTHYSDIHYLNKDEIYIEKDENYIPQVFQLEKDLKISFSLSHHGRYAAFVLALTNS